MTSGWVLFAALSLTCLIYPVSEGLLLPHRPFVRLAVQKTSIRHLPTSAANVHFLSGTSNNRSSARGKEIVVALRSTREELRVLRWDAGEKRWKQRRVWDLPTRIEALDLGDVTGSARSDIVIGLAGTSGPNHVRVYTFDQSRGRWKQIRVSPTLPLHVEDVSVGDVDHDGSGEIVAALERVSPEEPSEVSRVRIYDRTGKGWQEQKLSPPEPWSVQDVAVGDLNGDERREIIALFANVVSGEQKRSRVRVYERERGGRWNILTRSGTNTGPYRRAERLVTADFNADGRDRIVTSFWGPPRSRGKLVVYALTPGGELRETVVDPEVGLVDSLDVGDFNRNGHLEIIAGVRALTPSNQILSYEFTPGGRWTSDPVSKRRPFGHEMIWDVGLGDARNTGHADVIAALDERLVLYYRSQNGKIRGESIKSYPVLIDSAQVGNVMPD